MNIAVFGLGYVGSVSAACLAARGHTVVGVDVQQAKIDAINGGQSPVIEPDLDERIRMAVAGGRLCATALADDAVQRTDLAFVCVGTPSNKNGSLDLQYVDRVVREIGMSLRGKSSPYLVVIRSTVLPGTVEERILPILARTSHRAPGRDFRVAYNPEFLREGSAIQDFERPPKTIIGEMEGSSADALVALYDDLPAVLIRTSIRVAETVKYADNIYHALKVTFANEVGNVCQACGVDGHEVMRIFCEDKKLNLSPAYLKPGFAFGGSCLPKDLRAFLYEARSRDVGTPVLDAIIHSNEQQKMRALRLIQQTGKRRVGILGLSFKAGTDDLRESPTVELAERLLGKGYTLLIYDRNVVLTRILGTNKEYIEREIPHIAALLRDSLGQVVEESDLIVAANRDPEFFDVPKMLTSDQVLVDLVRLPTAAATRASYVGISW